MKISAITPYGNTLNDIECEWDLTRPLIVDRLDSREMDLVVDRRVPISQFSIITAEENGMVKFRGYCESNTIDGAGDGKTTWTVKGMENLLNARFTNRWFWKKESAAISEILSDTLTHGAEPGLLSMANSAVPAGISYTESTTTDHLITLAGYGTLSHFGQRDVYVCGETGLMKLVSYDEDQLPYQPNGYFRDESDLQILYTDRGYSWYYHGGLYIDNAYDTTVRIGNVYDSSQTLIGDLGTNANEIGDLIADIINFMGWTLRIRDDANYTYLDLMLEDGSGSANGLYTITEGEPGFICLNKSTVSDPKIHAVIGAGIGEQRYSVSNPTWQGIRIHEKLDVNGGFSDDGQRMRTWVDDRYNNRQEDRQYDIEIAKSYLMYPGDYIKFCPMYATPTVLRSHEITEDSTGKTTMSLGGKKLTFVDVEDARTSIPRGMSDEYLKTSQQSITRNETVKVCDDTHSAVPTGMIFNVPYGVTLPEHNPRVTLSFTLSVVDDIIAWGGGTAYTTGDEVYHTYGSVTNLFRCTNSHTSSASTEPDVGASWSSYWDKAADVREIDLGRCMIKITLDDTEVVDGNLIGVDLCSGGTFEIDITDYVTEEAANVVKMWVYIEGDYAPVHSIGNDHPDVVINATMNFYKRLAK